MKLYCCGISEFCDLEGTELLSPARRARMERYLRRDDKARCLLCGLLLRMIFGEKSNDIRENAQGKLYLDDDLRFNLSHSGEYVILGVSDNEIGVDIEQIAPVDMRVAKRCYTSSELQWMNEQGCDDAFYRIWTAKESVMKATGLGFKLSPKSFSVMPVSDGGHDVFGKICHLKWLALPGYAVCTASSENEDVELIKIGRKALLEAAFCTKDE